MLYNENKERNLLWLAFTEPAMRQLFDVARPPEWRKELDHLIVGGLSLDSTTFQVHPTAKLRLVVYTPKEQTNTASKLLQLQT